MAAEQQSPLARQRLMRGYTQEELAEKVMTTVSTVRRWERGEVHPQPGTRRRLASGLNISLDQLATLLDGEPVAPNVVDPATGSLGQRGLGLEGADEAVNRRQFVVGSVGALIGAAAIGQGQFWSSGFGLGRWAVEAVADHLGRTWHTLVATDNKFGPVHAIHGVLHSIKLASDALQQMSGADRQRVFQLDARFAESAAWLYEDMGDFAEASRWMQTAHQWADAADYPSLALWTLIGRARQAVLRRDAHTAVGLADQAINTATAAPAAMRTAALCYKAEALALQGKERLCLTILDRAEIEAANVKIDPDADSSGGYGSWCTPSYVNAQRARCWQALRKPIRAIPLYTESLATLPDSYHRDRGWALAGLSLAYTTTGEPEQASDIAHRAMLIASAAGSQRTANEVARVVDHLIVVGHTPDWSYLPPPA